MVSSQAKTVDAYIAELAPDRQEAISAVRKTILDHLPKGFEEMMQYGMIGYAVPFSIYPAGYHCKPEEPLPYAGLASQKNHISFYCMNTYNDESFTKWIESEFQERGLRLDMGKCCMRFRKLEDIPLDIIGTIVAKTSVDEYIAIYEKMRSTRKK